MALDEKLRWYGFWMLDGLRGSKVRKYYNQIQNSFKNGTSIAGTEEKIRKLIRHAVRTTKYYQDFGEDTPLVPDEHGNYTRPVNFRKRYYRILAAAGIEKKGLHSLRHTFASSLVNGIKQADGSIKSLTPRQVADLLGHSTSQITELYYVKKDTSRLHGITDGFNL